MELIHLIRIDTDNLVRTLWTDDDGEWSNKVLNLDDPEGHLQRNNCPSPNPKGRCVGERDLYSN